MFLLISVWIFLIFRSFIKSCNDKVISRGFVKLFFTSREFDPNPSIRGLMSDSVEILEIVVIAMCPFATWRNLLPLKPFLGVALPALLRNSCTYMCMMCLP